MTLQQLNELLETYLITIHELPVSEDDIEFIGYLCHIGNYLQVLFDYEIEIMLVILKAFEDENMFLECAKIKRTIEDTNIRDGFNYPTKLEEYENKSIKRR